MTPTIFEAVRETQKTCTEQEADAGERKKVAHFANCNFDQRIED